MIHHRTTFVDVQATCTCQTAHSSSSTLSSIRRADVHYWHNTKTLAVSLYTPQAILLSSAHRVTLHEHTSHLDSVHPSSSKVRTRSQPSSSKSRQSSARTFPSFWCTHTRRTNYAMDHGVVRSAPRLTALAVDCRSGRFAVVSITSSHPDLNMERTHYAALHCSCTGSPCMCLVPSSICLFFNVINCMPCSCS